MTARTVIPADELLTRARAIGQYYGFTPLSVLTAAARSSRLSARLAEASSETTGKEAKVLPVTLPSTLALDSTAEVVTSFLKHFRATQMVPNVRQPLFVWHTNIAPGRPAPKRAVIQFHALGADRALADAVVIRALLALARDLFHGEFSVRINSMGDRETRARYARELTNYFKKRAGSLPEDCVACARQDVFEAAELIIARECVDDLPAPLEHLSDASRKRFEDLLEYLEMTQTPYELARDLLSRGGAWSEACFEITIPDTSVDSGKRRIAWGSRYSELTRHYFPSAPFSATGAIFQISTEGTPTVKLAPSKLRFSFIHIGDEAKRMSIHLAEEFRRARLPLFQHIGVESLTEQLRLAEGRGCPYLLIMGRKEALENTAILRNRQTQEDIVLPLDNLIEHLRAVV